MNNENIDHVSSFKKHIKSIAYLFSGSLLAGIIYFITTLH